MSAKSESSEWNPNTHVKLVRDEAFSDKITKQAIFLDGALQSLLADDCPIHIHGLASSKSSTDIGDERFAVQGIGT